MSATKLFSLFDDRLKNQKDLIASPAQSLDSISTNEEDQLYILRKIKQFEEVKPRVDYSNFSNFIFFNSALDYFNITGEKILNEYPFDGSKNLKQAFIDDLDEYQKYVVSIWPKWTGHLRFNPSISSSYVSIQDVGFNTDGNFTTSILSPNTGSLSLECWCIPPAALTGTNDVMVVLQKITGSGDGYTLYFSGSSIFFKIVSGSNVDQVSALAVPSQISYFSAVYDRTLSTPLTSIITGSTTQFPVVVSSASSNITLPILGGVSQLSLGSGSLSGKVVIPLTGSLDSVRIWNFPRTISDISGTFNVRLNAQPNLVGIWEFNEKGVVLPTGSNPNAENSLVLDFSGHRLNGNIKNYFTNIRGSGSLLPNDEDDLLLSLNVPEVQSYISQQQTSGSLFDRNNSNIITDLLPDEFFKMEQFRNTHVLENFLYILARNFDQIKVRIDQFIYILRQNYGEFNQTPEALLADIGSFFGWEFTGNFLRADINQYIVGKNILKNVDSNIEIDKKLFEIKNEFWKRTLINLSYLYKTKGTRESVESLLRIYGVNQNFVRLKEFGLKPMVGISTFRILSEKSTAALTFGSSSFLFSNVTSPIFSSSLGAIEVCVRFPTTSSSGLTATTTSGSIWTINASSGSINSNGSFIYTFPVILSGTSAGSLMYQLFYSKNLASDITGSIFLDSPEGNISLTGVKIFDNRWYNIAFNRDFLSSSLNLSIKSIDTDEIIMNVTSSLTASLITGSRPCLLWMGATGTFSCQYWAQEMRVWEKPLIEQELIDHSLNFQSYGRKKLDGNNDLTLHWRLFENIVADGSGNYPGNILDSTPNAIKLNGSGSGFIPNVNNYKKFLNNYNYIPPIDLGWNEQLIRILSSSKVKPADAFTGNRTLALEFNMVDALNEDISQVISSLDNFNYAIGLPANKFRSNYSDLVSLRALYFRRLKGRLNFRIFSDMLEFFDNSFIDLVRRLIPARSIFLGDQFVVESHMLERPKQEWPYRRRDLELNLLGIIKIYETR